MERKGPHFWLVALPKSTKPPLSHFVQPLSIPFPTVAPKPPPIKKYDRGVFEKIQISRQPTDWFFYNAAMFGRVIPHIMEMPPFDESIFCQRHENLKHMKVVGERERPLQMADAKGRFKYKAAAIEAC